MTGGGGDLHAVALEAEGLRDVSRRDRAEVGARHRQLQALGAGRAAGLDLEGRSERPLPEVEQARVPPPDGERRQRAGWLLRVRGAQKEQGAGHRRQRAPAFAGVEEVRGRQRVHGQGASMGTAGAPVGRAYGSTKVGSLGSATS